MTRIATIGAFVCAVFAKARGRLAAELRGMASRIEPKPRGCGTSCACAAGRPPVSQRPPFSLWNLPGGTHVEIDGRVLMLGRLRSNGTLRAAEERRPDGTYGPETWIDLVSHARTSFTVVSARALALRVKEGDLSG